MDKQLDQLQIHSHKNSSRFRENVCKETVTSGWSQSVSKDTGLGSTQTDTPLSYQDLQSPADHMSESSTGFKDHPGDRVVCVRSRDRDRDRAVQESHQEEALWRLHRLLGDSCVGGDAGTLQPLSDSICTEDFARRFSQEMVHESVTRKRHGASTGDTKDLSKAKPADTQKTEARLKCRSPRRATEDGHNALKTPHVKRPQINTSTPKPKCVAGVPVLSFDSVSIDSDLDSVCTEGLRQHIRKQPGWRSFMESVRNLDELCKGPQDDDADTLQDTEHLSHTENTENQVTTPHLRDESTRPLVDEEEDLEDESKRSSPGMLSGCPAMRECLCSLQHKCQEEDTLLNVKRSQLSEVEHSLTVLQHKKQEALREIAQLRADTVRLEQERKCVECNLLQTKAEKDSVRHDLQMVQRQRDSAHHTAYRALDLSDKRCDVVVMSVLERDEMQRQLTAAKSDLFTEQRRARERLEALQERLDEAHEELQEATDAESALRDKCDSLEEQHRQSSHALHALESQVCELKGALEGSQLTVGTLEKILCEKELQLQELHKLHREEQSLREQGQSQLQQLKTQHYTALREARKHAHSTLQTTLQQHKRDLELRHQREIHKLKEEEAKKCKEELEMELLKKVQSAVEEEHSRREAEREEAVRVQSRLEQQLRDTEEHLTSKIQQEKNKARTLHSKLKEMHVVRTWNITSSQPTV
ncbi:myosin-7 [Boleophthalmus pectinirostris]|uniref:myosin-7 n=1 Tax=Boleophthalmus pectinirostris TaxID=150288 RepID=UPI0024302543|nr:myosin-7 [Boleophthalmus pectinirostris]